MDTRQHIGARIFKARRSKGLSQAACAEAVGVSRQMWINYENGKSAPTLARADRVAALLDIPRAKLDVPSTGPSRSTLALASLIETMVDERFAALTGSRT